MNVSNNLVKHIIMLHIATTRGVVTPIGAVVTAMTGVKKRLRGQGMFLVSVKVVKDSFQKRSRCNSGWSNF